MEETTPEIEEPTPKIGKKDRRRQILRRCLYGIYVVTFLAIGSVLGFINNSETLRDIIFLTLKQEDPVDVFGRPTMNLLILGTDEDREPGGELVARSSARSDVVMVVRLNFEENRITGLTIPRDTLAEIPGHGVTRINAAHSYGGPSLAEASVEGLIGVRIDRVVVVSYGVFQEMVDLVGGVEVDVKKRLKYDDERGNLHIDLYPGKQLLDGERAMGYVRYRRDSGFKRQDRQQAFLIAFKERTMQQLMKVPKLLEQTGELTGNVFTSRELASLFLFGRRVGTENIKLGMLPVLEGENYDLMVDTEKLHDTLKEYELVRT